jgi:hypothetical protein
MSVIKEDKKHARLSPSAAKRWMTCPGSIGMTEKLNIQDTPSRFAAEGTVAHEVHEVCLLKNQAAKDYFGKTIEADGFEFKVNDNMIEAVQLSLDYIQERIEMAELIGWTVKVKVEVRCSLKSLKVHGLDGGTSDVILEFWDNGNGDADGDGKLIEVEVFDYKHGAGVAVDAVNNPQAMCYGLGVILLPEYADQDIPDGITITISQPRAHHPDGRIRSWKTTKEDLLNWCEEELVPKAKATLEADAHLEPSDDGCRFCPVAGQCPRLFERTQEVAMLDFADSDDDPKLPDVNTLTADQKRFILDHAGMLRSFIVAVENQVKHEVDHGSQDYEGYYKLVRKTTRRKFVEDALDELTSPLLDHLDHGDIYEEKPRSMTEIERRLKKAIGVKDAKEVMADLTTKPEGELMIAPQSDKRKAQQPSLIGDFNDM